MTSSQQILLTIAEIAAALNGDGKPSDRLGQEVQEAVQQHSSSFIYSERSLEVGICSGMAVLSIISQKPTFKNDWTVSDIMAVGIWSALSFQSPLSEPKREALRQQVLSAAQDRVVNAAEHARERSAVQDFGTLKMSAEELEKIPVDFKAATDRTIEALRRNAALDREELDFLWWVMLDRSRLLNRPLQSLDEPIRMVVAGIEAAKYLRKLPCDVHYELVLRSVSEDAEFDLPSLFDAIGEHRYALMESFNTIGAVNNVPGVFPLLHALATGNLDIEGASVKRKSSEWGERALLEASVLIRLNKSVDNL
ncbi:hypothetical protein APX70_00945 [Pseudomonas syringae pv. maculicola]|uniref:GTPase-associated system helical domain-containing protein n=2 Tax=Pseudomonas syringae group genomosp. 3 TaxID=251701 RepID=A0A3M2V892_PSEYM|nr:hypothetical protein APX70_00945 [Pseudomonas syringae pv. maculicola]